MMEPLEKPTLAARCCRWAFANDEEATVYRFFIGGSTNTKGLPRFMDAIRNWLVSRTITVLLKEMAVLPCTWDLNDVVQVENGFNLIHLHVYNSTKINEEYVKLMVQECNIDINSRDLLGRTVFHLFFLKRQRASGSADGQDDIRILLEYGADPYMLDAGGFSSFAYMKRFGGNEVESVFSSLLKEHYKPILDDSDSIDNQSVTSVGTPRPVRSRRPDVEYGRSSIGGCDPLSPVRSQQYGVSLTVTPSVKSVSKLSRLLQNEDISPSSRSSSVKMDEIKDEVKKEDDEMSLPRGSSFSTISSSLDEYYAPDSDSSDLMCHYAIIQVDRHSLLVDSEKVGLDVIPDSIEYGLDASPSPSTSNHFDSIPATSKPRKSEKATQQAKSRPSLPIAPHSSLYGVPGRLCPFFDTISTEQAHCSSSVANSRCIAVKYATDPTKGYCVAGAVGPFKGPLASRRARALTQVLWRLNLRALELRCCLYACDRNGYLPGSSTHPPTSSPFPSRDCPQKQGIGLCEYSMLESARQFVALFGRLSFAPPSIPRVSSRSNAFPAMVDAAIGKEDLLREPGVQGVWRELVNSVRNLNSFDIATEGLWKFMMFSVAKEYTVNAKRPQDGGLQVFRDIRFDAAQLKEKNVPKEDVVCVDGALISINESNIHWGNRIDRIYAFEESISIAGKDSSASAKKDASQRSTKPTITSLESKNVEPKSKYDNITATPYPVSKTISFTPATAYTPLTEATKSNTEQQSSTLSIDDVKEKVANMTLDEKLAIEEFRTSYDTLTSATPLHMRRFPKYKEQLKQLDDIVTSSLLKKSPNVQTAAMESTTSVKNEEAISHGTEHSSKEEDTEVEEINSLVQKMTFDSL